MNSIEIKHDNVKDIIKHYETMLDVSKTEVQKDFYKKQIELYQSLIVDDIPWLNELDKKTLKACLNANEWNNRVFKVEIDFENKQIKVMSKRKAMKGKGFVVPLFKELKEISNSELEKYIYSKYTTSIYLYC